MTHTAVVAGVGPGLGASIARRFVEAGCRVGLFARSREYVETLAADLGEAAIAVPTDVTDREQVAAGFEQVRDAFGPVDVLVNHAHGAAWQGLRSIDTDAFETALAVSATGALHCSQAAVADMLDGGGGTVIFTGSSAAVRGRAGAVGFSAAKFAARGMAQSMARELGPEGVHVAHVVVSGPIGTAGDPGEGELDPDEIADSYWHLVEQDPSAWTLELDLRPHDKEF